MDYEESKHTIISICKTTMKTITKLNWKHIKDIQVELST